MYYDRLTQLPRMGTPPEPVTSALGGAVPNLKIFGRIFEIPTISVTVQNSYLRYLHHTLFVSSVSSSHPIHKRPRLHAAVLATEAEHVASTRPGLEPGPHGVPQPTHSVHAASLWPQDGLN